MSGLTRDEGGENPDGAFTASALALTPAATHALDRRWALEAIAPARVPVAKGREHLCDGERVVQVAEGVELPLLALHSHEELLDALRA